MLKFAIFIKWFIIGGSIAITLLSTFYLGRITTHPPTPVCALGRATEYPVLKPLYVNVLARALPMTLHPMAMHVPAPLPRKR